MMLTLMEQEFVELYRSMNRVERLVIRAVILHDDDRLLAISRKYSKRLERFFELFSSQGVNQLSLFFS
jgi:hypothetical protein